MLQATSLDVWTVVAQTIITTLAVNYLLRLISVKAQNNMIRLLAMSALVALAINFGYPVLKASIPDIPSPYVWQLAFVVGFAQICSILLIDACFLLKSLPFTEYKVYLVVFYAVLSLARAVCIILAYYFSLMRFWDMDTWLRNNNAAIRSRLDASALSLGLVYDLVVAYIFLKSIYKGYQDMKIRAENDFTAFTLTTVLKEILVSSTAFLTSTLILDLIAISVMLSSNSSPWKFLISDIARSIKAFAIPYLLIDAHSRREDISESQKSEMSRGGSRFESDKSWA
jgi:hypothetical protein